MQRGNELEECRAWLERMPAPSVLIDDDRRVVASSASAAALLDVGPGDLVDLPLHPSAGEASRSDERRVLGRGGVPFLASVSWGPITLSGRLYTLVQLAPLRAEGRALVERERTREVTEHGVAVARLGVFEHDHVTNAIWFSEQARAIYGWPPEQRATLPAIFAAAHPDDGPRVGAAVARAHDPSGDGLCDVAGRLFRPDGEVRWVRTRSRTFFEPDASGVLRPSRTVGALVDETDEHRANHERARLAQVLDATPDLVAIVDVEGRALYLNEGARRVLGLSADAQLASLPLERLGETASVLVREAVPVAQAKGRWTGDVTLGAADGARHLSVILMLHRDAEGGPAFYSVIARDVGELRALEHQLQQSQKMEAVGRLAGGIAHDFNNILSVILGYVEPLLVRPQLDASLRAELSEVREAASRAAELTRQMLAFSRKQVLRPQVVDPAAVLDRLWAMLRRIVGEDIAVDMRLGEPRANVTVDPHQLEQVVLNLVVNARDAMPKGGRLTIESARVVLDEEYVSRHAEASVGPHVMIAVTDDGEGMDAATRERIFEPFFTTKGPGKGTGLGLAMVYGIVRQSGGTLWVYSELGQGTTFKVYFPVTDEPPLPAAPPTEPAPAAIGGVILLVEDDESLRRLFTAVLRRAGYEVHAAAEPREALALARERAHFDLLLTDVVMPGMSGRQLAEALAASHPAMPVLYMSGYTENSVVHGGVLDAGIAFVGKPVTPQLLLAAVRKAMAEGPR